MTADPRRVPVEVLGQKLSELLRTVVELSAPREVYDRLDVPLTAIDTPRQVLDDMADAANVRLSIGQGRFGWEWLKEIALP